MTLNDFPPMLLDERPLNLDEPGWIYEIKFDGYRVTAMFGDGRCTLRTRKGADAAQWFPEVAERLAKVPGGPHVTDGEVCFLDDVGRSDFDKLQERARRRRWVPELPVVYCVFDLLVDDGDVIIGEPLHSRKARLVGCIHPTPPNVLLVGHFDEGGRRLFDEAVHQLKLEGLVAKRSGSGYRPGVRSADWVKVKRNGAIPPERFKRTKG
ncbi:hypothetical protein QTI66_39275 [Variovorax sp. J22R133]|uniref:ATP-dependent DNA ligase n=1 Tax=Variovorax brevis TaxID=3053503 RepID=UPI00257626FE|nr:hypothetical protein [Variovorax sp. J22R133]MDM0118112.1 hypothetical protein [Variovorax sp. J22R133]